MIENKHIETAHWYLLQTKYKQERKVAQELHQQNIHVFLPLHKLEKIVKGIKVIKEEPLFSRYLFAQIDFENTNWTSVRSTRGVSNYVEFGNGPAIVDQAIVKELKKIDSLPLIPYFIIGEKVSIVGGSLRGLRAIYQASDGPSRSHILLTFMQQNQYLSINNQLLK